MNRAEHQSFGCLSAFVTYFKLCEIYNMLPNILSGFIVIIGGIILSTLPDDLEPAISPNHRSFFHSLFILLGGLYILRAVYKKENIGLETKIILISICSSYASHIALDAFTPKGILLLEKGF